MDFEEFKRRSELMNRSKEGELEKMFDQVNEEENELDFENIVKYKGETFPLMEINIPLKGIWEFLGYLEISLDCFDLALKYPKADFFMIKSQIGNYAKGKIENFIDNNSYQDKDDIIASFNIFNGQVFFDADIFYKLSCIDELRNHYIVEQKEKLSKFDKINGTERKNKILEGQFRIDLYPYITSKQYEKDFFGHCPYDCVNENYRN